MLLQNVQRLQFSFFDGTNWNEISILNDLQNIPRTVLARKQCINLR